MTKSIRLSDEERRELASTVHHGTAKTRVLTRARILLKSADGWSLQQIATALEVSAATISNVRRRFHEGGVERVLRDRVQQCRRQALDPEQEAILIALTCSATPEHHDHWTLRMLRETLIAWEVVERISPATIHAVLKKTRSNRGNGSPGACPNVMLPMSPPWKIS